MEHIDMTDATAEFIDNQGVADFADAMRRKLEKKRAVGTTPTSVSWTPSR